jgi:cytochrome c-type biogenesis protein CcmH/NrfG
VTALAIVVLVVLGVSYVAVGTWWHWQILRAVHGGSSSERHAGRRQLERRSYLASE